jgi:hypothetical protein
VGIQLKALAGRGIVYTRHVIVAILKSGIREPARRSPGEGVSWLTAKKLNS